MDPRAASGGAAEPKVAFLSRGFEVVPAVEVHEAPQSPDGELILGLLTGRGASFATDLARSSGLDPSRVRSGLSELVRLGRVTNDRFEPLRAGAEALDSGAGRRLPRAARRGG